MQMDVNTDPFRLIVAKWRNYLGAKIWVNGGKGLLPYGTKPLRKPMLIYHRTCSVAMTWE